MPMDYYAQIYGKLRAAILSRHFGINNSFRTNFLNTILYLPKMPSNEVDRWREGVRAGDNPLMIGGMFMTCLAVEHYLGRQDALPIIRAFLQTIGSLYKFDGLGNHFDGYIIRWDPVLRDMFWDPALPGWETSRHSHAFYLNPNGTYNYCTAIHDPRSRRPMTEAEWKAASPEERDRSWSAFSDWQDRFRFWEPSMDELVGLIAGYDMVHRLVKRRLVANPAAGGDDVLTEIERQVNNLGDYLAEYGYYLVRPEGGFSARGASGALMALEYPFTRVFERITGNPQGTYNIRHSFQFVMEKADVWKALEESFNWYSLAGYTLSGLSPFFLDAATGAGASFLFGATCPFTGGQLGQIWAIYSHRHVFDVAMDYNKLEYNKKDSQGEFAVAYALSLLSLRRRFDDWMNGQAILSGGHSRGFAPYLGLTSLDDLEINVRMAYLNWFSRLSPTNNNSFTKAIAVVLQAGTNAEQDLVISLNTDLSADLLWNGEGEELNAANTSQAGTTIQRMTAMALAWLHRKLLQENGQSVTTRLFPELPDWNDQMNVWPSATIPEAVIDGGRTEFPLPEYVGAIQRGKTFKTLNRRPDGSVELFSEDPVVARSSVPPVQLFKPSQKLICDSSFNVPEWKRDFPTGIKLNMGDEFEIEAMGRIRAGVVGTGDNGPNGLENKIEYDHKFPLTGQPNGHPFCLLGKMGASGAYFFIGEHWPRQYFLGYNPHELFLRINDDTPGNGSGFFICRVRVWQANRVIWLYSCDESGKQLEHMEFRPTQEGTTNVDAFFVRHNGTRNVTISEVRIEGGDGAFKLHGKPPFGLPRVVNDQESGQNNWQGIELDFSPQRTGRFDTNVVVISDDQLRPELYLPISTVVTQPRPSKPIIHISPVTLDFGRKMLNSITNLSLKLSNTGNADGYVAEPVLMEENPPGQFLVPPVGVNIQSNKSGTFTIIYKPTVKTTSTAKAVFGSGVEGVHTIILQGEGGAPEIRLEPNPLDFGAVTPLTYIRKTFRIYNDGNMDLSDLRIIGGPSSFTSDNLSLPSVLPEGFLDVGATYSAPDAPGQTDHGLWDIASNDPGAPRTRLTLRGMSSGAHIEVIPESIDLGRPHGNKVVKVEIVNRGSVQLIVNDLLFEKGKVFKLRPTLRLPLTISSGHRRTIRIKFTMPAGVSGFVDDILYVSSNDPHSHKFTLHLRVLV